MNPEKLNPKNPSRRKLFGLVAGAPVALAGIASATDPAQSTESAIAGILIQIINEIAELKVQLDNKKKVFKSGGTDREKLQLQIEISQLESEIAEFERIGGIASNATSVEELRLQLEAYTNSRMTKLGNVDPLSVPPPQETYPQKK